MWLIKFHLTLLEFTFIVVYVVVYVVVIKVVVADPLLLKCVQYY